MSVLVTGGAGYIGSHMVLALLDLGEDVIVLDDLSTGLEWSIAPAATFHRGSIRDRALVSRILKDHSVTSVVHFAGSLIVEESVRTPLAYYSNNVGGMCDLLEEAVQAGVERFVFSSTAAVYGNGGLEPIGEDAPLGPLSPYGRSKLMGEALLRDVSLAHGLRYAALRYFNVTGADPQCRTGQSTRNATHLLKVALETALGRRQSMQLFGTDYPTPDGTAVRDYVHVSDLVQAHVAALGYLSRPSANLIANVGYGRGATVREVVAAVEEVTGRPIDLREAPRREGDPASLVADPSLLKRETGWAPRYDELRTIVAHAFEWEKHLARRNDA